MANNPNPQVVGLQFQMQGIEQANAQLKAYQSNLQQAMNTQKAYADATVRAYEAQIHAAQRAYEAKVLEGRETARQARESINNYRLQARAAEDSLRARIATMQRLIQGGQLTAKGEIAAKNAIAASEQRLLELRRRTERDVESMRIKERQQIDALSRQADQQLAKRKQLENGLRAYNEQNKIYLQNSAQGLAIVKQDIANNERVVKGLRDRIKELLKIDDAQKKASSKQALAQQKQAMQDSAASAQRAAFMYDKFTNVVGTLNPRIGFLAKSFGSLNAQMLLIVGTVAIIVASIAALTMGIVSLGKSMYDMGVQGNQSMETIATFNNAVTAAFEQTEAAAAPLNQKGFLSGFTQSVTHAQGILDDLGGLADPVHQLAGSMNELASSQTRVSMAATVLEDLRRQTRGTISDLDLMKLSLRALQGTALEFRSVVAPALGEIFDATARIARATGQSADIVREKFIYGLRREENRLLDDIGVKVDAIKANELYAASINKTVKALTEQEKNIAFTKEALRQLKITAGELGDPNATVENVARIQATIDNIRLRVSLALAPFADVVSGALAGIVQLAGVFIEKVAPAIKTVAENFKELARELDKAGINFENMLPVVTLAANIFILFLSITNSTITGIRNLVVAVQIVPQAFNRAFMGIPGYIGSVFKAIKAFATVGIEGLAYLMAYGGASVIGAFADGLYRGIQPVILAVTAVANVVADFLMGFSPPKKGPLHFIDDGAYNVGLSWVDGFMRGMLTLEDRSDVLGYVNARLGDIANFNMDQVDAGLARLDLALRPFQERLEIVKADMQAVTGFIDPALEAIDRLQSRSIRALKMGAGDVEALRQMDRQVLALQQIQDLRQDAIDQAEVQLAMASAQQIQERTLLLIQKHRLEALDKGGKDTGGADTGGAGGGTEPELPPSTGGELPPGMPFPDDLFGGSMELPNVMDDIMRGLSDGIRDSTQTISNDTSGLQAAMDRIGNADPGAKIAEKLSGITEKFMGLRDDISKLLLETFDMDTGALGNGASNVEIFNTSVQNTINRLLGYMTGDADFSGQITRLMDYLFGAPDNPETVLGKAQLNLALFISKGKELFQGFIDFIRSDFSLTDGLNQTILAPIKGVMTALAGTIEDVIIGIFNGINDVLDEIPDWVPGVSLLKAPSDGFITNGLFANARGSLGFKGTSIVGEQGREIVATRRPVDIFPNNATEAIIRMSQLMARNPGSQVVMLPQGGSSRSSSSVVNNFSPVFNTSGGRDGSMLRARQLYASMVRS